LSVLTFIPVVDDDGKYLTCRSENPFIPDSAIEDKWRLVVHCKSLFRVSFVFASFCFVHKITENLKHKKVVSIFLMTLYNEAIQSIKHFQLKDINEMCSFLFRRHSESQRHIQLMFHVFLNAQE
jgi:hypothetical protein